MTRKQRSDIKTQRNEEFIADYIKAESVNGKRRYKFTMLELVVKYQRSSSRLYAILDSYSVPRRRKI